NNLKQIALATHGYHDQNKKLPNYYGIYPSGAGGISGSWSFVLLPFMEQDNQVKNSYGPFVYSYKYTYTYNGVPHKPYNYSTTYPYSVYQASRAKGKIKTFISPLDVTAQLVESPISYLANDYAIYEYYNFSKITDGLSNTMFFAEGMSKCGYNYTYTA